MGGNPFKCHLDNTTTETIQEWWCGSQCNQQLFKAIWNLKEIFMQHLPPTQSSTNISDFAFLDLAATNHYFKDNAPWYKKQLVFFSIVTLQYRDQMKASHLASLNHPALSKLANTVQIYPILQTAKLLCVGQLYDNNWFVLFHKDIVLVTKHHNLIMQRVLNKKNGMWEIPLPLQKQLQQKLNSIDTKTYFFSNINGKQNIANGIIKKETTINNLINFLHAACFRNSKSTWIEVIKQHYFITWPSFLTVKAVKKYLPPSPVTSKIKYLRTRRSFWQGSIALWVFSDKEGLSQKYPKGYTEEKKYCRRADVELFLLWITQK